MPGRCWKRTRTVSPHYGSLAKAARIRNDNAEAMEYLLRAMEIDKADYKVLRDLAAVHVQLGRS